MTDLLSAIPHAELVLLLAVAFAVFWRLSNASVSLKWSASTKHPEPPSGVVAQLTAERDEARREAERLRGK